MRFFTIILIVCTNFLSACGTVTATKRGSKSLWARVTYYTRHEDKWGNKVACSTKFRAKQGRTVAAHRDFPFGTKVTIPDLKEELGSAPLIVEDRGSAVNSKKAVPKTCRSWMYDFDVYLDMPNRAMKRFASNQPPFMKVYVEQ